MELQTIRQVSQDYGISRQMLCYYEQIGLIESSRRAGYAYRVYGEDAIGRLQQIIILRKLQIPVKQIKDILANPNAVTVVEIFKQNIAGLDEQITALSAVRSILLRFVEELQEKADVQLKLDILNDKAMLAVVGALSFPENKIKERVSMEELNKASEILSKDAEKKVRVIYHLPATIACLKYYNGDASHIKGQARKEAEAIVGQFIGDTDLAKSKPDLQVFGFGDRNDNGVWNLWVTIPDDYDVVAPFEKQTFPGGLYAACTDHDFDIGEWVNDSDEYEWDQSRWIYDIEEYFNPYNIYGLKNFDSGTAVSTYTVDLYPIREIEILTEERKEEINTVLSGIEASASRGKTVEIDLTSMIRGTDKGDFDMYYDNGLMIMFKGGSNDSGEMITSEIFTCPVKIELRAKTDKAYIGLRYAHIFISLRWTSIPFFANGAMLWFDTKLGEWIVHKKCGEIPVDEFVNIEVVFSKEAMTLKINGELRHYSDDYAYTKEYKDNSEHILSGSVSVGTEGHSTVTVESLRITEL